MTGLGMILLGGEAYVTFKPDLIDEHGNIGDDSTKKFLARFRRSLCGLGVAARADGGAGFGGVVWRTDYSSRLPPGLATSSMLRATKDVDGRTKSGHDEVSISNLRIVRPELLTNWLTGLSRTIGIHCCSISR